MAFKIGDRVYVARKCDDLTIGATATIVKLEGIYSVGIQLDIKDRGRHDCGGSGKEGYCWNVYPEYIKLLLLTAEAIEKDRYDRVLAKIKYLDNEFETNQATKKIKAATKKEILNEKIQVISVQDRLPGSMYARRWPFMPTCS